MPSDVKKKQVKISSELLNNLKILKRQLNDATYEEVIWYLLSNREVWIAHKKGDEKKWMISWGNDFESLMELIEKREGPLEENSWQKILEQGYASFNARIDEENKLVYNDENVLIENSEIDEWIRELLMYPVGDRSMDMVTQPSLSFEDYKKMTEGISICPDCGSHHYEKNRGCDICGFKW
ncbi:MAG: hypothetical protein ACMUIE_07205 [Thermoplasmatota archaeon]